MNIQTAEEFLVSKSITKNNKIVMQSFKNGDYTVKMMIEFAKLKVTEALFNVSERAMIKQEVWDENKNPIYEIDRNSILNAYPLTNIK